MFLIFAICGILITIGTLYAAYLAIYSTLIIHKDERLYYQRKNKILDEINELLIHLNNEPNASNKDTIKALEELARYLKTY